MTTLLCITAHPDDETMLCGGTLAALAARGLDIHYANPASLSQACNRLFDNPLGLCYSLSEKLETRSQNCPIN